MELRTKPTPMGQVLWPSDAARLWATHVIERLSGGDACVLAIVFFGSAVRPVPTVGDLDLLVVFEGNEPDLGNVPIDVDVRSYSAEVVPELIEKGHDLLGWAIRYGVLAHERNSYWTELCKEWTPKLPFPSADVAEKRADRAAELLKKLQTIGDEDAVAEQYLSVLTHRARSFLLRKGIFPISRPELSAQLRQSGQTELASQLELALARRAIIVVAKAS